ncbi:MAG: amino acid ABC transporter permease [Alphaproteobacteria bacterium]|nr:amino acid ABC transporter permease [Alphaproteobacteria bacterium]
MTAAHVRLPPRTRRGVLHWLRRNLFNTWYNALLTVGALYLIVVALKAIIGWALVDAVWTGSNEECRAAIGDGACWSVIGVKLRFILFGTYPFEEQWRPMLAVALFVAMAVISSWRVLWSRTLVLGWVFLLVVLGFLMRGGVLGLMSVPTEQWGGLPVTIMLAAIGVTLSLPLAFLLALGRRSTMPLIRALSIGYIEVVRGVPLISVLFMSSVMFPLFLPEGITIDKLLRAQVGIILFSAAYLAEVVRGGLQAVPAGQYEAADALGLGFWRKTRLVVMPQAVRHVIPPMVNSFIATFKDTSLVVVIGLYDLLHAARTATNEPTWRAFTTEAYIFVALIFFICCFAMSRYSRRLEAAPGNKGERAAS